MSKASTNLPRRAVLAGVATTAAAIPAATTFAPLDADPAATAWREWRTIYDELMRVIRAGEAITHEVIDLLGCGPHHVPTIKTGRTWVDESGEVIQEIVVFE